MSVILAILGGFVGGIIASLILSALKNFNWLVTWEEYWDLARHPVKLVFVIWSIFLIGYISYCLIQGIPLF